MFENKIFQSSLLARTRHLLNLIATAENDASLLKRIENFIDFMKQYPEVKHVAVKVKLQNKIVIENPKNHVIGRSN